MKKVLAIGLAVGLGMVGTASAQQIVTILKAASGFYAPGATADTDPGILDPGANPSEQALLQLIFSPTATLRPANAAGGPTFLDPDDVSDGARIFNFTTVAKSGAGNTIVGGNYADGIAWAPAPQAFVAGNLFVRLFQGPAASLVPGNLYYEFFAGPAASTTPTSPQTVDFQANLAFTGFGDLLTLPIVPEPSSMLLLGVGVIGIVAARRRRNG